MKLEIPLDFERLPEFWQLGEALRARVPAANAANLTEAQVCETALVLFVRLWVVMGYLARHTNRPGWLNAAGERQFNGMFPQFGDDCAPVTVLEGNLLRKEEDGWYCDLFTVHNKHLSGDYVSREMKGNRRSRLNAARNNIAAMAFHQSELLPPDRFHRRDGRVMDRRAVDACMRLILTLDRCLTPPNTKTPDRLPSTYTEGLLADACAAVEATEPDDLREFCYWIAERCGHPATPRSTEELLKEFATLWKGFKL